jgi:MFS family permease
LLDEYRYYFLMTASSMHIKNSLRAPFKVRSFRFQWPADLAASLAFEMEILVLGWYVLVESGSVMMLVLYGALQFFGSVFSPLFGVAGDRLGYRTLFLLTRGVYTALAALVMVLAFMSLLTPYLVIAVAAIVGMIRPSDHMMRYALVGQTVPGEQLTGALGVSRMTADSARVVGALAGVGTVAQFGMAAAYVVIALLYLCSFLFSAGVADKERSATPQVKRSAFGELSAAFEYVWTRPDLLGAVSLAFLVNFFAFPFTLGLLPYIAKNVFEVGQAGLGALSASFALGALLGSLVLGLNRFSLGTGRAMLVTACLWFAGLLLFGFLTELLAGMFVLLCVGFVQSLSMTPLAAVMLRGTEPAFRGRVMGMRMLAIWGLPAGLLAAGPLIDWLGYQGVVLVYNSLGIAFTICIGWRWRGALWNKASPSNQHS